MYAARFFTFEFPKPTILFVLFTSQDILKLLHFSTSDSLPSFY